MNGLTLSILAFGIVFATGFRWFQLIAAVALPRNRGLLVASMLAGVACAIAARLQSPGVLGVIFSSRAILLGGFFVIFWAISAQKGGTGALQTGEPLLHFSAPDQLGNTFDSGTLDGRPILLKLFRGQW